ncbi:MAG: hypothetical protein ABSF49_02210 [Roseiarcus sp.]|jgi:hypothetical protein|uniref:bestrophin-like domain n=1 Tax=Roseiarcus sp. TaxID=1969460 RepID=UPI003C266299
MSELWPPLLVFFALCASAALGFFVHGRLPERHRTPDSIELVHLALGLLVTFTAIVLGLLTSSVKTGFENAYQARGLYAGQLAQLDRCLRDYGPETASTRAQLRGYVAAVIASTWPDEPAPQGVAFPDTSHMRQTGEDPTLANLMDDIGLAVRGLEPSDAFHRAQAAACASDYSDAVKSRWVVIEGVHGSISTPFYWVLVFWLAIVFASFGLRAPPNTLNVIVVVMCAVAVSSAVFVIHDLDVPYGGLFGVPSDSMRRALADMMQ